MRFAVFVKFFGRVQGVGFRMLVVNKANAFGISGWVRNCAKFNEVEAVFVGEEKKVQKIIRVLKSQKSFIRVDKVVVEDYLDGKELRGFNIKY